MVEEKFTVKPRLIGDSVYANSSISGDPIIGEIFGKYFPDDNPYTTVLGKNASRRNGDTICETLAKLYYNKGVKEFKDYKIVLGGGYLKTRNPYYVYAGNVTYADLFSVLPFDNDIVLGRIQGRYLKSRFLQADNSNYHYYSTVGVNEVSDSEYYYIITDSYTSTYRYNNITEVTRLKGTYARDLLAEFVSEGGWER